MGHSDLKLSDRRIQTEQSEESISIFIIIFHKIYLHVCEHKPKLTATRIQSQQIGHWRAKFAIRNKPYL